MNVLTSGVKSNFDMNVLDFLTYLSCQKETDKDTGSPNHESVAQSICKLVLSGIDNSSFFIFAQCPTVSTASATFLSSSPEIIFFFSFSASRTGEHMCKRELMCEYPRLQHSILVSSILGILLSSNVLYF